MRLQVKLKAFNAEVFPLNYYYPLSAAVYKLLQFGSPEFSEFLHEIGFPLEGKTYKLFNFSLQFDSFKIENGHIRLLSPEAFLFISSPLVDDFVRNFVLGTFKQQYIEINNQGIGASFEIEQMESKPLPQFSESEKFYLRSPMVLSTHKIRNGKEEQHYFRYYDNINRISEVFNSNLINKYKLVHGENFEPEALRFTWDYDFIDQRLSKNKKVTKKISIKRPGERPVEVIANEIPFYLEGSPELMKIGYESGFGEKNSMGFGMAEVVR